MKLCKDCRYYYPTGWSAECHRRAAEVLVDPVDGKKVSMPRDECSEQRAYGPCGPNATYWAPSLTLAQRLSAFFK